MQDLSYSIRNFACQKRHFPCKEIRSLKCPSSKHPVFQAYHAVLTFCPSEPSGSRCTRVVRRPSGVFAFVPRGDQVGAFAHEALDGAQEDPTLVDVEHFASHWKATWEGRRRTRSSEQIWGKHLRYHCRWMTSSPSE